MKLKMMVVKMKPLNEIFEVTYGNKLDLNKLVPLKASEGGINFVGRSSQNHGVSQTVKPLGDVAPFPAGLITVALGGSKLLSSFVQDGPFYTAQNVAVLRPLSEMTFQQKLYMCLAIRRNRFRYSAFGREANRTLRTLLVPDPNDFPGWISDQDLSVIGDREKPKNSGSSDLELNTHHWKDFEYEEIFIVKKGKRLTKSHMTPGATPFVGASDRDNGVTGRVGQAPNHSANTITVSYNGSVAEAFFQPVPYFACDDVNVLYPKGFDMTVEVGLFICSLIRLEKYRFNYGRKWHLERMRKATIKLPVDQHGSPDWSFVEEYMRSLPYSSQL